MPCVLLDWYCTSMYVELRCYRSFESIREAEHLLLVEMIAENLQPDRQAFACCAARHAHAGNARQAAGDGVNVGQIHLHRIVHLLADSESGKGRNRARRWHPPAESVREIARDQRAHFLRFQIIRVVIAVAQHVSAQHDAALHFGAEAFAARVAIHVAQRVRMRPSARCSARHRSGPDWSWLRRCR